MNIEEKEENEEQDDIPAGAKTVEDWKAAKKTEDVFFAAAKAYSKWPVGTLKTESEYDEAIEHAMHGITTNATGKAHPIKKEQKRIDAFGPTDPAPALNEKNEEHWSKP